MQLWRTLEENQQLSSAIYVLVKEPFPDPKSSRPINIIGSRALEPLKNAPTANITEPMRQRNENRNTPTVNSKREKR